LSSGKPKKRYSQNFLIDRDIAARIIENLEIKEDDTIFEIGSGRGILTGLIAQSGARLYSFEIDRELIADLEEQFESFENVHIANMDFLKVNPSTFHPGKFKLVGNIPYDITSPLITWITDNRQEIIRVVITTQKELAERISSRPGSKRWAPIALLTQCHFDIKNVLTISPEAFYPRPRVVSSTMLFIPDEKYEIENWAYFERIVRLSFGQRRKSLANNLSGLPGLEKQKIIDILVDMGFDRTVRAEQLKIEDYINLARNIESLNIV
jgi:16S rRNA (adenine1518-N6/adenine1519-N6)-dimethyltransferase